MLVNTCLDNKTDAAIKDLSDYDKFVFGSLMVSQEGNITIRALETGLANYQNLGLFCNSGINCDARRINYDLANLASRITFLLERFCYFVAIFQKAKIL